MVASKKIFKISYSLGGQSFFSKGLVFTSLSNLYISKRFFSKDKIIKLRLCFRRKFFDLELSNLDDINTIYEVFIDEVYKIGNSRNVNNVLDFGANIGIASIYFSILYPKASIYSLEPSPETYEILKRNTSNLSNIKTYAYAVSESDGFISFFQKHGRSHSSSLFNRSNDMSETKVKCVTISSLLGELRINKAELLKFDIEGAEVYLAKDMKPSIVENFIGEIHYDLLDRDTPRDLGLANQYNISLSGGPRRAIVSGTTR